MKESPARRLHRCMMFCQSLASWTIFPGRCVMCHGHSNRALDLCGPCEGELATNNNPCPRCAEPGSGAGVSCRQCNVNRSQITRCIAPFVYAAPLDRLVTRYKLNGDRATGRVLAELFGARIAESFGDGKQPDVLVPIPLAPRRQRERGFNQAHDLASALGRAINVPVDASLCQRVVDTPSQRELPLNARLRNVRNVFVVDAACRALTVGLVDDVVTTGATIESAARAFAGNTTLVFALARTPRINR